ncbi:hypothetical protein BOX15_Mlig007947g2, partial [Macrostomum lignano]
SSTTQMSEQQQLPPPPSGGESDKAFLTRHGVPGLVKEALGRLGAQQPADPLAYLAEFFASTEGRPADLEQAKNSLTQANWQSPGFLFSVKEAFDCLRQMQRDECRQYAVCGLHFTQLMELLLRDAPPGGSGVLLQRLRLRPQAAVQFGRFYSAVMSVLAFKAYMADCVALYADAEVVAGCLKPGSNNRAACACLLQLLDAAIAPDEIGGGASLFDRMDSLSPYSLREALANAKPPAPAANSSSRSTGGRSALASSRQQQLAALQSPMPLADFLAEAAGVFVKRLLLN